MASLWEQLAGGTVGGVIGISVVYPLDTVKSRLQTSGRSQYTGMTHVLTSMVKKEGSVSLYRGLLSPVVGYGAMFAITFSSYGQAGEFLVRRRGGNEEAQMTLSEMGLAGAWAGAMNSPFRQVFERVKSVMQVRQAEKLKAPYSWSGACAIDLIRREGLLMGLFRGMRSTLLREMAQFSVYYPTYAVAKEFLLPSDRPNESGIPEPVLQMVAGGAAGCVQWLPPWYCLDVVKTRMQTAQPGVYSSVLDCVKKTWRIEGVQAFYRGLGPSLLRAIPMHGLVFLGYETTISFLAQHRAASTADGLPEGILARSQNGARVREAT